MLVRLGSRSGLPPNPSHAAGAESPCPRHPLLASVETKRGRRTETAVYPGGTNGQWVRSRNQESVEALQAEQQVRSGLEREQLERWHEFRSRLWHRILSWFHR